jgi:hypothetical protein
MPGATPYYSSEVSKTYIVGTEGDPADPRFDVALLMVEPPVHPIDLIKGMSGFGESDEVPDPTDIITGVECTLIPLRTQAGSLKALGGQLVTAFNNSYAERHGLTNKEALNALAASLFRK